MFKLSKFCAYTGQKLAQLGKKLAQARWPCWLLFASLLQDSVKATLGISRARWELYEYVCEDHYRGEDIGGGGSRKRLKTGAVPLPMAIQDHPYGLPAEDQEEELSDASQVQSQISIRSQNGSEDFSASDEMREGGEEGSEDDGDMEEEVDKDVDPIVLVSVSSIVQMLQEKCRTEACTSPCEVTTSFKGSIFHSSD